jgi:hypothetical protein
MVTEDWAMAGRAKHVAMPAASNFIFMLSPGGFIFIF